MRRTLPLLFLLVGEIGLLWSETPIRVLIYSHDGASKTDYIERALENCNRFSLVPGYRFDVQLRHYTPDQRLDAEELEGIDVLLVSGGWVDTFHPNWVREDIRRFVAAGGGYVGICAGEILAIEGVVDSPFFGHYEGLQIAPHVSRRRPEWVGSRNIRFTEEGTRELGLTGDQRVLHWNGSILEYKNGVAPPGATVLATFEGNGPDLEMPQHGRDRWRREWNGEAAMLTDFFGRGRVLLSAPHPEHPRAAAKYQKQRVVGNMVRWAYSDGTAPTVGVGREEILPASSASSGLQAMSALVTADLSLDELAIYVRYGRGRGVLGVYDDASGRPGRLVARTGPFLLRPEGGWVRAPLVSGVRLSKGSTVWLAWQFEESVEIACEEPEYPGDRGSTTVVGAATAWREGALPGEFPAVDRELGVLLSVEAAGRPLLHAEAVGRPLLSSRQQENP